MIIEDATVVAGISALSGVLVKIADLLWAYINPKKQDEDKEELISLVRNLHLIISRVDEYNVPCVYSSRKLVHQSDSIVDYLKELLHNGVMTNRSLEKLTETLERIVIVLARLEDRTGHK